MYFCCTNFVFGDSEIYEIQSYRKDYPTEVIIATIKKYFQSKDRNPKRKSLILWSCSLMKIRLNYR